MHVLSHAHIQSCAKDGEMLGTCSFASEGGVGLWSQRWREGVVASIISARVVTSTAFLFCSRGDCIARSPRQVLSWGSPTSDSIHTVDHSPRTCEPAGVGSSPVCVHARGWCVFVWCAFWRTSSTARPGVTTFFLQVKNQIKQF